VETLSLSELKAQNELKAKEDLAEDEIEDVDLEAEESKDEEPEKDTEKIEAEDEEAHEDEDPNDEPSEDLEEWQVTEGDGKKGEFVPNAEAKRLRLKNRDLKQEAKDKEAELEELRARVEQQSKPEQAEEVGEMPTLESAGFDPDVHAKELAEWYDKKLNSRLSEHVSKAESERVKKAQLKAYNDNLQSAVDTHYTKAAELIHSGKITEDNWTQGDKLIRQSLELAYPQAGEALADNLIALMAQNGKGSEKVWSYLGNNPTALNALVDKVKLDKTGGSALMYLAGLQHKASNPIRRKRVDTPKPADTLTGDAPSAAARSFKKEYDKADANNDIGTRLTVKRAAKAKGVDVSSW
jgi:hypothetical protein